MWKNRKSKVAEKFDLFFFFVISHFLSLIKGVFSSYSCQFQSFVYIYLQLSIFNGYFEFNYLVSEIFLKKTVFLHVPVNGLWAIPWNDLSTNFSPNWFFTSLDYSTANKLFVGHLKHHFLLNKLKFSCLKWLIKELFQFFWRYLVTQSSNE